MDDRAGVECLAALDKQVVHSATEEPEMARLCRKPSRPDANQSGVQRPFKGVDVIGLVGREAASIVLVEDDPAVAQTMADALDPSG